MTNYIWNKFKELFPWLAEGVDSYKLEGKHGIKMTSKDGSCITFTFDGLKDYSLTVSRKRRQK